MALGHPDDVEQIQTDLESAFDCKCEGELKEYVDSKIDIEWLSSGLGKVKFTNPVLVQKLEDEYDLPVRRHDRTPAVAGQVLVRGDGSGMLDEKKHKVF